MFDCLDWVRSGDASNNPERGFIGERGGLEYVEGHFIFEKFRRVWILANSSSLPYLGRKISATESFVLGRISAGGLGSLLTVAEKARFISTLKLAP